MPPLMTELRPFVSPPLVNFVATGVDDDLPVTRNYQADTCGAWQRIIDERLMEWLRHPERLADDGLEAPSGTITRLAIDLAERFRDEGQAAPDSVVIDANGGIVFERRGPGDSISEAIHVWDDGTLEYHRFQGTQLVERAAL